MVGATAGPSGELLSLLGYAVGSALVTLLGFVVEYDAVRNVVSGHTVLAVWFGYVGAIALFVGLYLLGYQALLPRLSRGTDVETA